MQDRIAREYKRLAADALSALHSAVIRVESGDGPDARKLEVRRQYLRGQYQGIELSEQLARRSQEEIQYGIGGCPFDVEAYAEDLRCDEQQKEYRRLFRQGN